MPITFFGHAAQQILGWSWCVPYFLTSPLLLAFMWILCVLCVNPVLSHGLGVFACLCVTCPWVQCLIVLEFGVLLIFGWWFTSGGHHKFNIWLFMSSVSCHSCVGQQWFTLNLCGHLGFNTLFLKCGILPFTDCDSLSPKSNILLFLSLASCCSLVRTTNLPIEARGITSQGESPPSISSPSTFSSPFTHFLCTSCVEMFSSTFHNHHNWGICMMYVLPQTLCPFVKTWPSWEWHVLLWSPLVVILNYYYFPCVKQWLDHPGSGAYFYNRFWHLFSTTTTTFCVVEHNDLTVLGVVHTSTICLWYSFSSITTTFCVIKHDDSTILGVAHTSTIISGGCSLLLLLLLCGVYFYDLSLVIILFCHYYFPCCQAWWLNHLGSGAYFYDSLLVVILFCHYYFPCVEHDDSTVLGGARTSTITSCGHSLLLLLSVCRASSW